MRKQALSAVAGAVALFLTATAAAQTALFDEGASRLAPTFKGADVERLIAAARKREQQLRKGEFESTARFEERLRAVHASAIAPGIPSDATLAFLVEDPAVSATYDADKGALQLAWDPSSVGVPGMERQASMKSTKSADSYVGSNAFNAKVKVARLRAQQWGVVFTTDTGYRTMVDESLTMSPAQAMALKKARLRAVLIGRLDQDADELVETSTTGSAPTINAPIDIAISRTLLKIKLIAVWVFDQGTGEVLVKHRPCLKYPCQPDEAEASAPTN